MNKMHGKMESKQSQPWHQCNIALTNPKLCVLGALRKCSYWLLANGTVYWPMEQQNSGDFKHKLGFGNMVMVSPTSNTKFDQHNNHHGIINQMSTTHEHQHHALPVNNNISINHGKIWAELSSSITAYVHSSSCIRKFHMPRT